MEFEEPLKNGFTVYTKSGCLNCSKVKKFFYRKNIKFHSIDCDEYLIENKPHFLFFIKTISNVDYKMFPIVFKDGNFIGGYKDTIEYLEEIDLKLSFDESF